MFICLLIVLLPVFINKHNHTQRDRSQIKETAILYLITVYPYNIVCFRGVAFIYAIRHEPLTSDTIYTYTINSTIPNREKINTFSHCTAHICICRNYNIYIYIYIYITTCIFYDEVIRIHGNELHHEPADTEACMMTRR